MKVLFSLKSSGVLRFSDDFRTDKTYQLAATPYYQCHSYCGYYFTKPSGKVQIRTITRISSLHIVLVLLLVILNMYLSSLEDIFKSKNRILFNT